MAKRRSSKDIRRSIGITRGELTQSVNELQVKVSELSDWRAHLRRHPGIAVAGAFAAGFVLAGGVGGLVGLLRR